MLAELEVFEAGTLDSRTVEEQVLAAAVLDEAESLVSDQLDLALRGPQVVPSLLVLVFRLAGGFAGGFAVWLPARLATRLPIRFPSEFPVTGF